MGSPARSEGYKVEDLYGFPDDGIKYELQAGWLVSEPLPGTRHGRAAVRIAGMLDAYVRLNGLGVVVGGDSGFILARSPDTVRGPDVAFVTRDRFVGHERLIGAFPGPPDLAVEVLSPSNSRAAMHSKVADYLAAGTRCVWVVDPEAETVAVYRTLLAPRVLNESDTLDGEDVIPGFRATVWELFAIW